MTFAFIVDDITADFNLTPPDFRLVRAFALVFSFVAFAFVGLVLICLGKLLATVYECWYFWFLEFFLRCFFTVGASFT